MVFEVLFVDHEREADCYYFYLGVGGNVLAVDAWRGGWVVVASIDQLV